MFHFQNPVNDWPRAVAILPAGYWVKAVDSVQLLNEAKSVNPGIKTVLRHHYDTGQQFDGGIEGNKKRARDFFKTFIDGTFDNYAHNVDAIEEFNEYLANSQNTIERQQRVDWVTAAADVWKNEYRNQDKYAHIKLVIANAAIGNDIPVEFAKVATQYDCLVGYHPYVPTKDKAVLPGEWPNYAGRWTEMDKRFVAAGYKVQWLFTEGGPVRYDQNLGGGFTNHLDPQGGWRMGGVCNADINNYVAIVKYWLDQKTAWNKLNNNRALGEVLFTSGGGIAWKWFETKQPEMDAIANMAKNYVPEEPGMSWQDELWNESIKRQAISLNPNAALQAAIFDDGFVPVQSEFYYTTSDEIQRACMAAEHLETGERRVYYAVVPEWNNVQWFTDPKLPSLATL